MAAGADKDASCGERGRRRHDGGGCTGQRRRRQTDVTNAMDELRRKNTTIVVDQGQRRWPTRARAAAKPDMGCAMDVVTAEADAGNERGG
ncbi:hypothetical protein OsI_07006 [Oryza sativa Indica Group]|jgi:hypothetical protein|uniref:Uncharacterized protein n=1 Tax=Oryza sativa subsp. indica TaxID=39946 RepID=A2X472_ORYSI|nr:hypothetical protein OsI_07006 [Oryza sativa Indica Group]